jgi:alpha-tubulin suppressor-like RCC1 family protein
MRACILDRDVRPQLWCTLTQERPTIQAASLSVSYFILISAKKIFMNRLWPLFFLVACQKIVSPLSSISNTADMEIAAGSQHTCIRSGGKVFCFGANFDGQLGDGTKTMHDVPTEVVGLTDAVQLALSGVRSCARRVNGKVACWGDGQSAPSEISSLQNVHDLQFQDGLLCAKEGSAAELRCLTSSTQEEEHTHEEESKPQLSNKLAKAYPKALIVSAPSHYVAQRYGPSYPEEGHSCALVSQEVYCIGANQFGQLGDGSTVDRDEPVAVKDLHDAVGLALGEFHSCALRANRDVVCWGQNEYGELGNGDAKYRFVPTQVKGISSATAIYTNEYTSCAINGKRELVCWGHSLNSQEPPQAKPEKIIEASNITQAALGDYHICALTEDGRVFCKGSNTYAQLGDGTTHLRNDTVEVPLPEKAVSLLIPDKSDSTTGDQSLYDKKTCAVLVEQSVYCWGYDFKLFQSFTSKGLPRWENTRFESEQVRGLSEVVSLKVIKDFSCALQKNGEVFCWGENRHGQVGDGSETPRNTPQKVKGLQDIQQISINYDQGCALAKGGKVFCWGSNYFGQVGDGTTEDQWIAKEVSGLSDALQVETGVGYSCALRLQGKIDCWGYLGLNGEVSTWDIHYVKNYPAFSLSPKTVATLPGAKGISISIRHLCAVLENGEVNCLGRSYIDGAKNADNIPNYQYAFQPSAVMKVPEITDAIKLYQAGADTCVLRKQGHLTCFSEGPYGEAYAVGEIAQDVSDFGFSVDNECIVHIDGSASCRNTLSTRAKILSFKEVLSVTNSNSHGCALFRTGSVSCWGSDFVGQLGRDAGPYLLVPTKQNQPEESKPTNEQVAATKSFNDIIQLSRSCALRATGDVVCWGSNKFGVLGAAIKESSSDVAVKVSELSDVMQVSAANEHVCALRKNGDVFCWGSNESGQRGSNPNDNRTTITTVLPVPK